MLFSYVNKSVIIPVTKILKIMIFMVSYMPLKGHALNVSSLFTVLISKFIEFKIILGYRFHIMSMLLLQEKMS